MEYIKSELKILFYSLNCWQTIEQKEIIQHCENNKFTELEYEFKTYLK